MSLPADFFAEFAPVDKTQWLAQIAKDLKGKALDDLYWNLVDDLRVDPFAHADDQPEPPYPLCTTPIPWAINEDIAAADPLTANRQALEALAFGAESLQFSVALLENLPPLLEGIHLDYIEVHFRGAAATDSPAALLHTLAKVAQTQHLATARLRGTLYCDPLQQPVPVDWRYWSELFDYAQAEFPGYRTLSIACPYDREHPVGSLCRLLQHAITYFQQGAERGIAPAQLARQLQLEVYIGQTYYLEIARLRALRLLWLNVLEAWKLPLEYPVVDVRFAPEVYTDDLYTNMVRATTMAMSAVIGGAHRLTVLPYDAGREHLAQYPQAFGRRMARNVQHLLKLESGFAELADPAAGSYFLEKLTAQLAERVWERLVQV